MGKQGGFISDDIVKYTVVKCSLALPVSILSARTFECSHLAPEIIGGHSPSSPTKTENVFCYSFVCKTRTNTIPGAPH